MLCCCNLEKPKHHQGRFLPYRAAEFTWVTLTSEAADTKAVPEGRPRGKAGEAGAAEPRADPPYPRVGKPGRPAVPPGIAMARRALRAAPADGLPFSPLLALLRPGTSCRPAAILQSRGGPSGGPTSSRPGEAALPRDAAAQV